MDKIIIHSVPRSGSTWLGNIFNSHPNLAFRYQPLFSYAFKDYLTPKSTSEEIDIFFKSILNSNDDFINQTEAVYKNIVPNFDKKNNITHICYKEVRYHHIIENMILKCPKIKVILLIRNPISVLNSWKNAPREFKQDKGWVFDDEWLSATSKNLDKTEEFNGYNKWKETAFLFLKLYKLYPDNVRIIKYSDLLWNTTNITKELFNFTKLKLEHQTINFINESRSINSNDPYSVFKVKNNDRNWEGFPNYIIEFIKDDLKNTILQEYIE